MSRRRKILAAAAIGAGAVAAGRVAGQRAVHRLELRPDTHAAEPFGSLRGLPVPVTASDGTRLYAEVDGADRSDLAVVFSHGWTLTQDSWHFQRKALRGLGRLVFWDQRGHGRSGAGPRSGNDLAQLGDDLAAVIAATVPAGTPVILIGHSMGGMTVMRYADEKPAQIIAAGLVCTSSGGLGVATLGMPPILAKITHQVMPSALRAAGFGAPVLERFRHLARDGVRLIEDQIAFGPDASPAAVAFAEEMMADTRMEALVDLFASMTSYPQISACSGLAELDTLVIGAELDALTPLGHSLAIAAKLPSARLEVVAGAGHMAMLERPATVSGHLGDLIERARAQVA